MFRKMFVAVLRPFESRRGRAATCLYKQRRIVSMIDDGCSYAIVRRRLAVRSTDIDIALRQNRH